MYKVLAKTIYNEAIFAIVLEAPLIAQKAKAGQFCILIASHNGERVPFTLADWDKDKGTITLIIQVLGKTTRYMMNEDLKSIPTLVGPLGEASVIDATKKKVIFAGGGLGIAALYPILRAYKLAGAETISIIGFRSKNLIFWEDEIKKQSSRLIITTDDGTYGTKGRVTDPLKQLINDEKIDLVYGIGPLIMMKAVSDTTRESNTPTIVSLNPVMVDGMGMCGACRVTVNEDTRYACVQGPEFDGHQVDFDELIARNNQFKNEENLCLNEYIKGKNINA